VFVLRREEVTAVMTVFVVVAVPETVSPPAAVPLPIVVDARERRPPEKVSLVDVAFEGNGYPMVLVMVTAPVAPETLMPAPATFDVTPVLVTLPFRYVRPEENVVVAALYTPPVAFTPSPPFVSDEMVRLVVDADTENVPVLAAKVVVVAERVSNPVKCDVDDAKIPFCAQIREEVAAVVTP